jgi:hypothetical protein
MDEPNNHNSTVLKELSDVKASLAVNTNETQNIKNTLGEIKQDIREIKSDSVSRREFNESINSMNLIKGDVETLKEFRWKLVGITSLAAAGMTFIGQLILNYLKK